MQQIQFIVDPYTFKVLSLARSEYSTLSDDVIRVGNCFSNEILQFGMWCQSLIESLLQVPDVFVLQIAAFQALNSRRANRLKTKSLHAELVYNLAGTKQVIPSHLWIAFPIFIISIALLLQLLSYIQVRNTCNSVIDLVCSLILCSKNWSSVSDHDLTCLLEHACQLRKVLKIGWLNVVCGLLHLQ